MSDGYMRKTVAEHKFLRLASLAILILLISIALVGCASDRNSDGKAESSAATTNVDTSLATGAATNTDTTGEATSDVISFGDDEDEDAATNADASGEVATPDESSDATDIAAKEATIEFENIYDEMAKVYADVLNKQQEPVGRYGLADIDSDGLTELLISEGDYHAASVQVYKFKQDDYNYSVVDMGQYGSYGELAYIPDEQIIVNAYFGQGIATTEVYKLKGYEAELEISFWDNEGAVLEGAEYKVNDKNVSASEYEEAISDYYGDDVIYLRYDSQYEIADADTNLKNLREALNLGD